MLLHRKEVSREGTGCLFLNIRLIYNWNVMPSVMQVHFTDGEQSTSTPNTEPYDDTSDHGQLIYTNV